MKRLTAFARITFKAAVIALAASAQTNESTCNRCSATYIASGEIEAFLQRSVKTGGRERRFGDQQVRSVDAGKTGIAVGVVYRGKLNEPAPQSVALHHRVSEVYHILEGTATLVTGSDVIDLKARPSDDRAVRYLNGPGGNGSSVRNGAIHHLKPGDVIIIPAGVGHWFTRIDDHIKYLMVRVDPEKIVPPKDASAAKFDLESGGKSAY
ncbi:MAG: AraC family ligand binding domain-containing protein [Acidobacteria bacterium]|nr:AraC family ligand binding domain-containing protein [Acidobacteriota bacterium]MBI3411592.1 AraC family ligand binding domain-containing protein [Planctomycetota bacterium]